MQVPQCKLSPIQKRFESKLLELLHERDAGKKRYPLSPSGVLSCQRRLSYDLINYETPDSIPRQNNGLRQLLVFDNGHRAESMGFDWLAKTPNLEVIEDKYRFEICKLSDEHSITGEIDRWIHDRERDQWFIADWKTTNTKGFKYIEDSLVPRDSNYFQVQLYLAAPKAQERKAHGLLCYEDKDTQEPLFLEFPFDQSAAEYGIARLYGIYQQRGQILPRDYLFGKDWQCGFSKEGSAYCPYHEECYKKFDEPTRIVIGESSPILDDYVEKRTSREKFEVIQELLKYGDATQYQYGDAVITLDKLKTTLSPGVQKKE